MYDRPPAFKTLQIDMRNAFGQANIFTQLVPLVTQVELGFELFHQLSIQDEPVTTLWVLLNATTIRHPKLETLSEEQKRAIANACILLPGFSGRFGWELALQDYIRTVPTHLRLYDFAYDNLEQQLIANTVSGHLFPNRRDAYQQSLLEPLQFARRVRYDVAPNKTYCFRPYVCGDAA